MKTKTKKSKQENYKVCYRLKEEHQDPARLKSCEVQESPNFFTEKESRKLANIGNNHFKRAEHWVERRR